MPVPSGSFRSSSTAARLVLAEEPEALPDGGGGHGTVAARLQQLDADGAHGVIVVDDEYGSVGAARHVPAMLSSARKRRQPRRRALRLKRHEGARQDVRYSTVPVGRAGGCLRHGFLLRLPPDRSRGPGTPESSAPGLGHDRVPPAVRVRQLRRALQRPGDLLRQLDGAGQRVPADQGSRGLHLARPGERGSRELSAPGRPARRARVRPAPARRAHPGRHRRPPAASAARGSRSSIRRENRRSSASCTSTTTASATTRSRKRARPGQRTAGMRISRSWRWYERSCCSWGDPGATHFAACLNSSSARAKCCFPNCSAPRPR